MTWSGHSVTGLQAPSVSDIPCRDRRLVRSRSDRTTLENT